MEHIIDANGQSIGRTASKAAVILLGKNDPSFAPNAVASVKVKIINAGKASVSEKKLKTATYERYSGYPGGLKTETMEHLASRKGMGEIFRRAVYGMLPANKLRARMMKNLAITD